MKEFLKEKEEVKSMTENQKKLETLLLGKLIRDADITEAQHLAQAAQALIELWRLADEQEENRIESERYFSSFNL